jgi:hypothetical protein
MPIEEPGEPVAVPGDALVIRFRPTNPDSVLRRSVQEFKRIGRHGASVFVAAPEASETDAALRRRLLAVAELVGMTPENHPKFYVCTDGDRELIYLSVNWPSLTAEATSSTYEETTTPTTRLLFIGASTAATTTTSLQEPWFELVPRPCLADIGGGDAAMWITAPLYESSDWLLKGPAEPYVEMHQVNVSLANSPVVAA